MTNDEKAKAYDMALEAARKELGCDRKEYKVVEQVLKSIFPELAESESEDEKEMRYCIEFINPCFPLLDNGKLNVRHLRVPDEHWAEMAITLILSFGGKIYSLYRGNVVDGKLGEWPTPMIIDSDDWFSDKWLYELIDCGHNCI